MKYTLTGNGFLTAETPIAVSPPDHFNEARRLHQLPRETVYRDGSPIKAPIIPAATFRGALRHAITGYAFEELNEAAKKKLFKVDDYIWTAQGGITDKKVEGAEEFVEITIPERVRRENPIMGLWGNFTHKMASLIEMRAARAVDPGTSVIQVAAQVRTDPLERDYGLLGLFDRTDLDAFQVELVSRRQMVKAENEIERHEKRLQDVAEGKREMGPEAVKEVKEKISRLQKEAEALAEKAGGAVNLQQITTRHEAIAEGAQLEHGWTLKDVTVEEAAVLLLALRVWVANGSRVGALQRSGFGKLRGYYDLTIRPTQGASRLAAPARAGRFSFAYETGTEVESTDEVVRQMLDAEQALIKGGIGNWKLKAA